MKKIAYLLALTLLATLTGCTIKHPIAEDYPAYLSNNTGDSQLPSASGPAAYALSPATSSHHYEFRSAVVGHANLWIVNFGQMLDNTLQSTDVQQAFGRLEASQSGDLPLLSFELQEYRFADFRAYITLKVNVSADEQQLFSKTYKVEGKSQGGKMFWGGSFAMKNAIQQSTKLALDDILRDFIQDYNQLNLAQK
ncbi:MAG: lipoprotein [Gammaproteobacteria bacterium]|uniref:lipoprotein n=1 Tax=Pseudomonas sp. FEMGT703P TaxID=2080764 RepID=UPI000CA8E785|nr:lipoprotein [Pseudomonas sp. FEMGT703P]PJE39281.1 MAG: hypothetical protein CUR33_18915 [Pseudomonas sp.] [Pseudomonas sp. FEMGT703P]